MIVEPELVRHSRSPVAETDEWKSVHFQSRLRTEIAAPSGSCIDGRRRQRSVEEPNCRQPLDSGGRRTHQIQVGPTSPTSYRHASIFNKTAGLDNDGRSLCKGLLELTFVNSSVNGRIGIHVLRTNRPLAVLVSLQPINTQYGRDANQ